MSSHVLSAHPMCPHTKKKLTWARQQSYQSKNRVQQFATISLHCVTDRLTNSDTQLITVATLVWVMIACSNNMTKRRAHSISDCFHSIPPMMPYVSIMTSMFGESVDIAKPNAEHTAPNTATGRHPNLLMRAPANGANYKIHQHVIIIQLPMHFLL